MKRLHHWHSPFLFVLAFESTKFVLEVHLERLLVTTALFATVCDSTARLTRLQVSMFSKIKIQFQLLSSNWKLKRIQKIHHLLFHIFYSQPNHSYKTFVFNDAINDEMTSQ